MNNDAKKLLTFVVSLVANVAVLQTASNAEDYFVGYIMGTVSLAAFFIWGKES